jgi:hypothetical protein
LQKIDPSLLSCNISLASLEGNLGGDAGDDGELAHDENAGWDGGIGPWGIGPWGTWECGRKENVWGEDGEETIDDVISLRARVLKERQIWEAGEDNSTAFAEMSNDGGYAAKNGARTAPQHRAASSGSTLGVSVPSDLVRLPRDAFLI